MSTGAGGGSRAAGGTGARPLPADPPRGGVKETLISLTIALAMAFIAKMYVLEAYRIPTGSMAPTLLGAHMSFVGPTTGYRWSVDPWHYMPSPSQSPPPLPMQGGTIRTTAGPLELPPPAVTDPMTASIGSPGFQMKPAGPTPEPKKLQAGDRILVQKYLYEVRSPERWDVAVFKNPSDASVNYIKRVVGEAGEAVWLVDGDVFTAQAPPGASGRDGSLATSLDWQVQRKPIDLQERLWRPVFSSEYTPLQQAASSVWRFSPPWEATRGTWDMGGRSSYALGTDSGELVWDTTGWPITDFLPYNEVRLSRARATTETDASRYRFPVGDLRVRFAVRPERAGATVRAAVISNGLEFEAEITGDTVAVRRRTAATPGNPEAGIARAQAGPWQSMAEVSASVLRAGRVTDIELWHADQAVTVVINGKPAVRQAPYDLSPAERIRAATGRPVEEFMSTRGGALPEGLREPRTYAAAGKPTARIAIDGSPAVFYRVGVDKDLFYRPFMTNSSAFGAHPENIAVLRGDEYFVLGDNSGASLDSRGWRLDNLDPWVSQCVREWTGDTDVRPGVVHRKLMLGKAFFVYWPATFRPHGLFVPDVGGMRLIY